MIQQHGSPLPYLDQWDAEAAGLYVPYFNHQLSPAVFFRPNNEHRIVFTQIYNLALLVLNGQWDGQLQMVVNAIIHCACLAAFGLLMANLLGPQNWPWIWTLLTASLALPFAWENILSGFQSQFYFLLIASLLTIWLLGTEQEGSRKWWFGVAAGCLALFTMATGFMAAAAVACIALFDIARGRRQLQQQWRTLLVCSLIVIAGVLLKAHVDRHDILKADSVEAFLRTFGRNLSWPLMGYTWLAGLNLLPMIVLVLRCAHSQEELGAAERVILGIGFWAGIQALAMAYARGGTGYFPAPRYMDILSFLMIANGLSIILLLDRYGAGLRPAPLWRLAFALWVAGVAWGLHSVSAMAYQKGNLPFWDRVQDARLVNARAFMATDDAHVLMNRGWCEIPFDDVPELVSLMRTPSIRTNLPACVREPLNIQPANREGFVANGWLLPVADAPTERSWGSYSATSARKTKMFESEPVKASALPYLEIAVAGNLGAKGTSLELVDVASGAAIQVRPAVIPGARWVNVRVKAPAGPFKVVARDETETRWF
ncbi:MAG TPA: hypothetical protein VFB72_14140, partial [Verrucomicrobiae bacterium]|nr:hypothetical protein [Verrucomicrobiae bacterium]